MASLLGFNIGLTPILRLAGAWLCVFPLLTTPAFSETIPLSLKTVIRSMDTQAKFRDDALVTFSNGETYVLLSPAEPKGEATSQVTQRIPEESQTPDLIELSDGHFLLRIISLPNGRKTFPILANLPLTIRSSLLPQNFTFPEGFLLPTPWKSLTGNLLTSPSTRMDTEPKSAPLAIVMKDARQIVIWDIAEARVQQQLPLHCTPSDLALSNDATELFVGCISEPTLSVYSLSDASVRSIQLPEGSSSFAVDKTHSRLFITHPTLPQLSVYDLAQHHLLKPIALRHPGAQLVLSPFRNQLYVTFRPEQPQDNALQQAAQKKPGPFKKFFFNTQDATTQTPLPESPTISIINLATLTQEKMIPALAETTGLHVQDEKVLWMVSQTEKSLLAFDLRWHEYSTKIPLPDVPVAMASDETWLYLLCPSSNTLQRLHHKTMQWGSPITLAPNAQAKALILDPLEHQAFILSSSPSGIQVVNLDRGEWVGTELMPFEEGSTMAWVIPTTAIPDQRVRIKFQDGRLMLQNVQGHPWEVLPIDPHGPPKNQSQPVSSETPSDPEATPTPDNSPKSPLSL